ncbi:unnamed protein product (macronuclear) [Paramecium tetraurelia]|uniref:RING-type domain-containing protein n=1 Tax=Paramecium tetraurelia TaxID=5888 RepID=A0BMX4_PARTE|nr:uncharacterized protein GSPATT00030528001 [Paramecium tetraurelia]CAK59891.1 unnamed protein product [Paramecium tetraurelia]|eukprot:XP_001427289.1 hypothetical protein (macronuclear) [Paramecium tetraurelia strain d4-2]
MHQQTSRKQCQICQMTRDNTYQNPNCMHSYCLNCCQNNKIKGQCEAKDCKAQINLSKVVQYFEEVNRIQMQGLTGKQYNNNSEISVSSSIKSSMINKSKQYASPNESIYDSQQFYSKNPKMDISATLNYCALCLFYIRDDLLKQQLQVNKNNHYLECQLHTICAYCVSYFITRKKSKKYYCEICERLIK